MEATLGTVAPWVFQGGSDCPPGFVPSKALPPPHGAGMDSEDKGHPMAWPTQASSCDSQLLAVETVGVRVRALAPRPLSLWFHTPRQ